MADHEAKPFKGQYQEWCRVQWGFSHHDIWWVKGQQIKTGNWTLALLAAIVAARKLLWDDPKVPPPQVALVLFWVLGGLATVAGAYYAWDLYNTLAKSRKRGIDIIDLVDDPHNVLKPQRDPKRHWGFPALISLVGFTGWGITLSYFGATICWVVAVPAAVWLVMGAWGYSRPFPD